VRVERDVHGLQIILVSHVGPSSRTNTQPSETASLVSNLADFSEHGNKYSGFAKGETFFQQNRSAFRFSTRTVHELHLKDERAKIHM
jgi:hypothetical protein